MKRLSSGKFFLALGAAVSFCTFAQAQQPVLRPLPAAIPQRPVSPAATPAVGNPAVSLTNFLAFDDEQKAVAVTNGTPAAHFTFNLTNISPEDVTISYVRASCGCTVAQLPSTPWKLLPKESGQFSATMQLAGTPPGGTKIKTLTVVSDKGSQILYVRATVLPSPGQPMTQMDRLSNQKIAQADRQKVFQGSCATCHVVPAKDSVGNDKMGKALYDGVCSVCHEAATRATFVPDLHHLPEPTNPDFWRNWIAHGKPGTLMPAFARAEGGILTDQQIESLVQYLSATIPSHRAAPSPAAALQAK